MNSAEFTGGLADFDVVVVVVDADEEEEEGVLWNSFFFFFSWLLEGFSNFLFFSCSSLFFRASLSAMSQLWSWFTETNFTVAVVPLT